ncbi:MAG: DEAD/DEAH box helicase [Caulobacteraceae bacterium]|nr:DEAD/DEAH box helicase [Caulobacter sp.]
MGLAQPLLRALDAEGYTTPTPIQAQAIQPVMAGRDLLGIAQTGTGKTAAFALPILHRLQADPKPAPRRGCRVLVLSPTRELATQIADSFRAYGKHLRLSVAVVFGGAKINPQIKALAQGVDVLVATPGRLLDHLGQHTAFLGECEIFVLDEADQMLDQGFIVPIRRIVKNLTTKRQTLFFSATMPTEIGKLAGELLRDPLKVEVTPQATTVERVDQKLVFVEADRKRELLLELFEDAHLSRTIVFTRTKRGADRVAKFLEQGGVSASAIHGDKSQPQRERALASFKRGDVRALVATDIAARGIDIDAVSHVVQYELPNVPEAYVHRIGRTARAGADGIAVAFCADDERNLLRDIQRATRQTIPSVDRRRDPQLAVMAKATRNQEAAQAASTYAPEEKHDARPPRQEGDPRRQPHRQRRNGSGQGGGRPNHDQRQAAAARVEGKAQAGGHGRRDGQAPRHDGQRRPEGQAPRPQGQRPPQGQRNGAASRPRGAETGSAAPRRQGDNRRAGGERWDPANS